MKTFDAHRQAQKREGLDATTSKSPGVQTNRRPNEPVWWKRGLQALTLALLLGGVLTGCAYYGFSGASVPSHLNTLAIPIATNNTASPIPTLGRDLTNRLTDQFIGRTRYTLNNNETDADAVLTTQIRQYTNRPTGVSGDERASTNSVEIEIQVRYYDQVRDSTMLDQTFTGTGRYDPVSGRERDAAQTALDNVTEDIFTTATSNW